MNDIMIKANSFSEARKLLRKRFFKVGIPIRIGESMVYRFIETEDIKPKQKDIQYTKAYKKFRELNNYVNK